jgi:hypothetical protein
MNYTRWLQLKRMYKLSHNARATKRGQSGYYPAYKYDYIYGGEINNTNLFIKEADFDFYREKTSWDHGGYGESNSGIVFRVIGKPQVTHGSQTVIMSDVSCTRPRAYIHRDKLHDAPTG